MAVDERARRKLHERLEEVLGDEAADTLMQEMGSLGREQLATRHDLQLLDAKFEAEFAAVRTELAKQGSEFAMAIATQTRQLGIWMLGAMTTLTAIAFGAAKL